MQFRRQSLNLNTILYQCRVIVLLQQPLDVRLPVQDLPAKLDIGNPSLVPVILQAPAADLQRPGKLPVGQEPFRCDGDGEPSYPRRPDRSARKRSNGSEKACRKEFSRIYQPGCLICLICLMVKMNKKRAISEEILYSKILK